MPAKSAAKDAEPVARTKASSRRTVQRAARSTRAVRSKQVRAAPKSPRVPRAALPPRPAAPPRIVQDKPPRVAPNKPPVPRDLRDYAPSPKGGDKPLNTVSADSPPLLAFDKEKPVIPLRVKGLPEPPEVGAGASRFDGESGGGGGAGSWLGGPLTPPVESAADDVPIDEEPMMEGVEVLPWWKDPEFYKDPRTIAGGAALLLGAILLKKKAPVAAVPQPTVIVTGGKD